MGYETALTRYFAVAKWSEYGYWVISIVMAGFALSGVVLALFRDAFARHGETLLAWLPALLVVAAAIGFHFTTTNPFNPLQLQNPATWQPQLWNIAGYYACLLPFFFLAGVFVSLSFVLNADRIGRVYGFDLTGAGAGAALVLAAMFVVHAFFLVPLLLVPLAASALLRRRSPALARRGGGGIALLGAEALLLFDNQAQFNDFKAIYAPLHTPDARVVAERAVAARRLPAARRLHRARRHRHLQRRRHAGRAGPAAHASACIATATGSPPCPSPARSMSATPRAALDALPYQLIPHANVLLAGASGGFRIAETLALGRRAACDVLEPEPVLLRRCATASGRRPPGPPIRACAVERRPVAARPRRRRLRRDRSCPPISSTPPRPTRRAFTDRGDRRLSARAGAGRHRLHPGLDPRFPGLCPAHAGHGARRAAGAPASPTRRRTSLVYRSAWNVRILLSDRAVGRGAHRRS